LLAKTAYILFSSFIKEASFSDLRVLIPVFDFGFDKNKLFYLGGISLVNVFNYGLVNKAWLG
tara:strand:+ start:584 stop:769 length:186 start_codon:yes stop_codon:yes gene_type:complete